MTLSFPPFNVPPQYSSVEETVVSVCSCVIQIIDKRYRHQGEYNNYYIISVLFQEVGHQCWVGFLHIDFLLHVCLLDKIQV